MTRIRRTIQAAVVLMLAACSMPTGAMGKQVAKLDATFRPYRLGASSTILFGFNIGTNTGAVPSPLTNVDLALPAGLNGSSSTMGQAVCRSAALEWAGGGGCPQDSRMGYGTAVGEVEIAKQVIRESAHVETFLGRPEHEHTALVFNAEAWSPLYDQFIIKGQLLADSGRYGGRIDTPIPVMTAVPGVDISVVAFHSTLGPYRLKYRARVHGRTVTYIPQGFSLPHHCPRGGFPFMAVFKFLDGSTVVAHKIVPCPR